MLVPEPLPGAAAAGPDFIEDEGEAVAVAELAHLLRVLGRVEVDAALALDRLHQDAGGFVVDGGLKRLDIAGGDVDEPRHFRSEAGAVGRVAGGGNHRQRAAVEAARERQDLPALAAVLAP